MKIIPYVFHKNNSSLEPNGIDYLVTNEAMTKTTAYMPEREELNAMTIEQMSDAVIRRYGYEAKRTISFFRTVEKGDYEKIVKAYHKIMK